MTDPLTALRELQPTQLDPAPTHARIDALINRRKHRRRLPALTLIATAAAAAVVVLTTGGTPTMTMPAAATAATVLHDLGKRASRLPTVELTDGQYYAVRVRQYAASGKATSVDMRTWSHNGDGRELVLVDGSAKRDGALPAPTHADLSTFPTEPAALAARMREEAEKTAMHPGSEPTADDYIHTAMQTIFDARQTSPAVLRGIYDFLATLPGVRLIGDVKDPLGRTGKAVAVDGDPDTQEGIGIELILNPETGLPLASVHYRDGDVTKPWLYTTREEGVVTGTDTLP